MTRDSNFKRLVRTRMDTTGETYMQARSHFNSLSEGPGVGDQSPDTLVLVVLEEPVLAEQEPAKSVRLERPIRIGRATDNDLVLHEISVSRHHAVIIDRDGWTIRDLNTTNGTRVNGTAIQEHRLRAGDQLQLGTAHIEVQAT